MQRVDLIEFHTPHREKRRASLALLLPLAKQLKEPLVATCIDLVIMQRPRRAGLGVLSPRRAPNLGKIRRRACLRLIPFTGTGDVLLAPTMISHPLAYVAPTTRQCSCLPWPAVMSQRPHRPYYSHCRPGHPSTHPHPLLFCDDGNLTPQSNQ